MTFIFFSDLHDGKTLKDLHSKHPYRTASVSHLILFVCLFDMCSDNRLLTASLFCFLYIARGHHKYLSRSLVLYWLENYSWCNFIPNLCRKWMQISMVDSYGSIFAMWISSLILASFNNYYIKLMKEVYFIKCLPFMVKV